MPRGSAREVAEDVRELGEVGLTTILVGDDPASEIYIGHKHAAATAAGIRATDLRLPATTSEEELLATIARLNADDAVDALLVQLPLPGHDRRRQRHARDRSGSRTSTASIPRTPASSTSAGRGSCPRPRSA